MKKYESQSDLSLLQRLPVVIRIDGNGFSKWTKKIKAEKPYDAFLSEAMYTALKSTCSQIEGCKVGYTQSDEATIVLRNDQSFESEPWFGNRVQKIASITSSIFTAQFNAFSNGNWPLAYFDARVFVVPTLDEAINCLIWRQNDAVKNSIYSACYYEISKLTGRKTAQKMMHGKNQNEQQELLFQQANINWDKYNTAFKRGIVTHKVTETFLNDESEEYVRSVWKVDKEVPKFTQNREYLVNILGD